MKGWSSIAAVAVACAVVRAAATQNPQPPPVFRATADVVQLDVTVLDKQRRPVRGLAQGDFTVLEDGKPQSIVAFDAVNIEDPPPPPVAWMRDVTPDVSNNSLAETRLFVLVIDDACIPMDQRFIKNAKTAVQQFVDKLGPRDLTAVVFTADNRRTQDFTNDRTKLLATMEKFSLGMAQYLVKPDPRIVPTPPPDRDNPPDDSHFFLSAIGTLGSVADYLIAIPHRRKALIWISPGVPVDFEAAAEGKLAGALGLGAKEMARSMVAETDKVFQRAQRANVAIYPIDPTGLGGLEEYMALRNGEGFGTGGNASKAASRSSDYMQMAAANTGGHAIVNTDDYGPGLDQLFIETGSYYLIGFKSTNSKPGSTRRLEVKVNRADVEVRTRNRYETPAAEKPEKASATPLAKAISGLLPVGELPMQVTLTPFAIPGTRQAAVAIALKISQPVPPDALDNRVTLSTDLLTTAFTATGEDRGFQKHTAKIQLRPGANGEARYEMLSRIDLAPGRYRLRLAAYNEGSGKTGSVFADVIVPSFADEFVSMSGVALSVEPGRPSAPREALASLLPIVPTAEREFLAGDKLTGFVRLYQNGKRSIEPARVVFRVTDSRNRVLLDETRSIAARQFAGATVAATVGTEVQPSGIGRGVMAPTPPPRPDPFANSTMRVAEIRFPVPFDRLGPGPHLLTIEVTIGTTILRRDVRFTIQ